MKVLLLFYLFCICLSQLQVFDQYLNFISLEDDLFCLSHYNSDSLSYYGMYFSQYITDALFYYGMYSSQHITDALFYYLDVSVSRPTDVSSLP